MNIKLYLAAGTGGMFGAIARYGISVLFGTDHIFPYTTLFINLSGCFLISFLLYHPSLKQKLSPELFAAFSVGVIGAFTTFSTFAVETIQLMNSHMLLAAVYILLSVAGGILFCMLGFKVASRKWNIQ
ncbi:fluoride efflux transporter CrcB [Virgibacillus indicus]|nr:fluoride efflux transporter CrcB [Virgibacillus indicus]